MDREYYKEELEDFENFFKSIFWNISTLCKLTNSKIPLISEEFLKNIIVEEHCKRLKILQSRHDR